MDRRLQSSDFDGQTLVDVDVTRIVVEIDLHSAEQAIQEPVRRYWDPSHRFDAGSMARSEVMSAMSRAKLATVHVLCANMEGGEDQDKNDLTIDKFRASEQRSRLKRAVEGGKWHSAKIDHALKLVQVAQGKVVVGSEWLRALDVFGVACEESGIKCLEINGLMNTKQRNTVLETFKTSTEVKVLLLSQKAAGTGLNVECADTIILLGIGWNPASEAQLVGRILRGAGGVKHVFVLIASQSQEEYMYDREYEKDRVRWSILRLDEHHLSWKAKFAQWTDADFAKSLKSHGIDYSSVKRQEHDPHEADFEHTAPRPGVQHVDMQGAATTRRRKRDVEDVGEEHATDEDEDSEVKDTGESSVNDLTFI